MKFMLKVHLQALHQPIQQVTWLMINQKIKLPQYVMTAVKEAAQKAALQTQPTGIPERIYTKVKQKII